MKNNQYLNEEKYLKIKNKLKLLSALILIVGLCIGLTIIFSGVKKQRNSADKLSNESKQIVLDKIEKEKDNLISRKEKLKNDGVKFNQFATYENPEEYELLIITRVLDPSFGYCSFDQYKKNPTTTKYCSLLKELDKFDSDYEQTSVVFDSIPYYMIGGFIIIFSLMIASSVYFVTIKREIAAFTLQQHMPIVKEGMDEITPTVSKNAKTIVKDITEGIQEGLKDSDKK